MPKFSDIFGYYYRNKLYVDGKRILVPTWVNDKVAVDQFCHDNDVPRAKILKTWSTPREIELDGLPTSFVIKPSNLNSSRGVQVLERVAADQYFDHFTERTVSAEDVVETQMREFNAIREKEAHRLKRYKVIAQERMVDEGGETSVVTDYKFWVIGDEVQYVRVNDGGDYGNKIPICFYDGNFSALPEQNDLVTLNYRDAVHIEHKIIDRQTKDRMLAFASDVAKKMGTSFLRVDLFLTEGGIKLGELTAVPGSPHNGKYFKFTEAFDHEMGEKWAKVLGISNDAWRVGNR